MTKKPYTAPTITDHGDAVEQTKGLCGRCWETYGYSLEGIKPDSTER
jgi:hypothetical protein